MASEVRQNKIDLCRICSDNPIVAYCSECGDHFCQTCRRKFHSYNDEVQKHVLQPATEICDICSLNLAKLRCRSCQHKRYCYPCWAFTHDSKMEEEEPQDGAKQKQKGRERERRAPPLSSHGPTLIYLPTHPAFSVDGFDVLEFLAHLRLAGHIPSFLEQKLNSLQLISSLTERDFRDLGVLEKRSQDLILKECHHLQLLSRTSSISSSSSSSSSSIEEIVGIFQIIPEFPQLGLTPASTPVLSREHERRLDFPVSQVPKTFAELPCSFYLGMDFAECYLYFRIAFSKEQYLTLVENLRQSRRLNRDIPRWKVAKKKPHLFNLKLWKNKQVVYVRFNACKIYFRDDDQQASFFFFHSRSSRIKRQAEEYPKNQKIPKK